MNILPIILVVAGVFSIGLGYLIRFRKMVEILAGYDPNKVKDNDGLAKWVGTHIIFLGIVTLCMAIVPFLFPTIKLFLFIIVIILVNIAIILKTALGTARFEK